MSRASKAEKLHNFLKDLESQPEEETKEVLRERLNRLQHDKEALTSQVTVNIHAKSENGYVGENCFQLFKVTLN
jgi:hypothetical protein